MLAKNLSHTIEVAKALDAEIVISPNAGVSNDDLFRLLRNLQPSAGIPTARRLLASTQPISMIDNLHRAYMAAEGEFCFPLGDDDELCAAGLRCAMDGLEEDRDVSAVYAPYMDVTGADEAMVDLPDIAVTGFGSLLIVLSSWSRFAPEAPMARTIAMKVAIKEAPAGVYFGFGQLGGLLARGRVEFNGNSLPTYRHINHGQNHAWKFAIENVEPMRAAWEWLVYKACEERGHGMNREEKAWWADHIAMRMTDYYALAAEGLRREGKDPGQYDWRAKLWSA